MIEEYLQDLLKSLKLPITIGDLPGSTENHISLILFGSYHNSEYMGARECTTIYNPIVRFIIRNISYDEGKTWVEKIQYALHRYHDDRIISMFLLGSPHYLGRNEQKLHEFQLTFDVQTM